MSAKERVTVVCIDGSEASDRALDWYRDHLHSENGKAILAHVHQMPYLPIGLYEEGLLIDSACETILEDSIERSKELVQKYKELCETYKISATTVLKPCEDSVGFTLCKIAKDNKADAIVIGQRGLGVIRRTLLGSVSDYVLHHSHIPTVIVPLAEKKDH